MDALKLTKYNFEVVNQLLGEKIFVAFLSGFCNQLLRKQKELRFVTHHQEEGWTIMWTSWGV